MKANFAILARHLPQIVVLKQTPQIIALRPRSTGLHSRFHDELQTRRFREYCSSLYTPAASDFRHEESLATEHFGRMAQVADIARQGIVRMGLITKDKKLGDILRLTRWMLRDGKTRGRRMDEVFHACAYLPGPLCPF